MNEIKEQVKTLIKKASEANDSTDAMKFSQAAVNSVNALYSLFHIEREEQIGMHSSGVIGSISVSKTAGEGSSPSSFAKIKDN